MRTVGCRQSTLCVLRACGSWSESSIPEVYQGEFGCTYRISAVVATGASLVGTEDLRPSQCVSSILTGSISFISIYRLGKVPLQTEWLGTVRRVVTTITMLNGAVKVSRGFFVVTELSGISRNLRGRFESVLQMSIVQLSPPELADGKAIQTRRLRVARVRLDVSSTLTTPILLAFIHYVSVHTTIHVSVAQ